MRALDRSRPRRRRASLAYRRIGEFAPAYHAALQAANMAIACAGYRIVSKVGHHRVSLETTKLVLGKACPQARRLLRGLSAKAKHD